MVAANDFSRGLKIFCCGLKGFFRGRNFNWSDSGADGGHHSCHVVCCGRLPEQGYRSSAPGKRLTMYLE